jgi:hypothetical protein
MDAVIPVPTIEVEGSRLQIKDLGDGTYSLVVILS